MNAAARLSHPYGRALGVFVAAVAVFFIDTGNPAALHQLWLPLALAGAAWLMTRALMAVAFASFALAAAATDFGGDWISARAYPLVAITGLSLCAAIAIQRFRRRIDETHHERWAGRTRADENRGKE